MRRCGLVAAQAGCAALAFSTAARSSAADASATLARTVPSMGCMTSCLRPLVPATRLPPMKWPYSIMVSLPGVCLVARIVPLNGGLGNASRHATVVQKLKYR